MEYDFSGYATKVDLTCSDGRVIKKDAFKNNDGERVPLVWQHRHNEPSNILGHAMLENRPDGVYAYGKFNDTPSGKNAKELVKHKDIQSLSIYANQLVQKGADVVHGMIREVSLVLSGANPEALIDNIAIAHSDGTYSYMDDEAIIYTEEVINILDNQLNHSEEEDSTDEEVDVDKDELEHDEDSTISDILATFDDDQEDMLYVMVHHAMYGEDLSHADEDGNPTIDSGKTMAEIFDTLNEEQKNVVYAMLAMAAEEAKKNTNDDSKDTQDEESKKEDRPIKHEEESNMKKNVFDNTDGGTENTLSHSQIKEIFADASRSGSLKDSVLQHAAEYGVENIELLFPDAANVTPTPEMISRDMEWVSDVLKGSRKTPFSRIKSTAIDVTAEEARAKGYVKGNMKKDEIISTLRRTTGPTTIYKKQKLDRDDITDITDFDIVMWLKAEMRMMLNEEIARAVLIGDGRDVENADKINEQSIRPIAWDNNLYSHKVTIPAGVTGNNLIEAVLRARKHYKGKGKPKFYTTETILVDLLLLKDKIGRRLYNSEAELAHALRVSEIVSVEPMEDIPHLLGIMVNMSDYTIGTNKGGEVSLFDDFDIDFNQHKYLIEARMSGALTAPKTALVFVRDQGTEVEPYTPSFNDETGVLTVPSRTGVVYKLAGILEDTVLEAGAQEPIEKGETIEVIVVPADGYHFPHGTITSWEFTRAL